MIFDLDLWSLQILGIQHLAGRFIIGLGFPYNAFWNSPALGKLWFRSKRRRYQSALDYLKLLKEEEPHRKIYVSGHSLGGGLAHLVASELQLPAVTLSAPGVVETAGLLGLEPLELQDLTVNVIPDSHLEKSKSKESLTDHHDHQMPRNLPDKSLKCLRLKQPPE
ncbi:unnamed protein product, partial [Durusdinium trenchii]